MDMLIVGLISWWYGTGWRRQISFVSERMAVTYDYFSIDILARTLFSPFRQISAGRVSGPIGVQMRAFFDRLISRVVGAVVRLIMIFVGVLALLLEVVAGILRVSSWLVVPATPIIGLILALISWVPWQS